MIGIGRHAPHPEKKEGFEAAYVLLRLPKLFQVIVVDPPAHGGALRAAGHKPCFFLFYPSDYFPKGFFVEINVCYGGEKPLNHQPPSVAVYLRGIVGCLCKPDERTGQLVLKICRIGAFAANAGLSRAGRAARGLLALKTEHFVVHINILSFPIGQKIRGRALVGRRLSK